MLVASAQGLSLLDRQILSILAPSIKADLKIGDSELGLLYGTLFSLFYALFSLPLGRLVDGWIRTRLLSICIFAWSIFAGLSAFAGSFAAARPISPGVGVGEAAAQPGANSIIFDTFPRERRGTAMAALGIATALGLGLSMALGGVVAGWWDARFLGRRLGLQGMASSRFLIAALPGLLLAWLILRACVSPFAVGSTRISSPEDPASVQGQRSGFSARSLRDQLGLAVEPQGPRAAVGHQPHQPRGHHRRSAWLHGTRDPALSPRARPRRSSCWAPPSTSHMLQWFVVGFGLFVIVNLFQSPEADRPADL